ncbi:RagB/SusD family nutrient uptake outer membrane protein [uncultured Draconibacterium sp.]|uniref:RagB/SusD family nutrient uptake outer membrane protein n=1 Tax=uncultured Draconibacterium sp. TaxID=1573823 RepID=UPI0029C6B083|nr:RagB/SusD family nutrient uptake outer membrane protein [uncultured Draconibacterium sp.]
MKHNRNKFAVISKTLMSRVAILILFFTLGVSCDEEAYLKEEPVDFLAPSNSYVTYQDFEAAVYHLHVIVRNRLWGERGRDDNPRFTWYGTDLALTYFDTQGNNDFTSRWGAQGKQLDLWKIFYEIIYDANVIIGRSVGEDSDLTADEQKEIEAEARFFRGFAYMKLAHLWGGVPIVLKETSEPKKDYVRATRQETYEQAAADLEFAAANLADIDVAPESRINRLAASHVLSEVYLSLNEWDKAIIEASKVIDHPATALMTERFGTRMNETAHPDFFWARGDNKDVYWDLFRQGNQDRSIGNTESIWNLQYSYNVPGGGDRQYELERFVGPYITRATVRQSDGTTATICRLPSTYYMGRSQGYVRPSDYFFTTLWEKSGWDEDIRNAPHNIVRDVKVNNPGSEYHGKWVYADNLPLVKETNVDSMRYFYPMIMKVTTPEKHPLEFWDTDQTIPGTMLGSAEQTWRKHYMIRLADTYLLRAEAYLGKGEKTNAAADINVVRSRANAPDVAAADVDIDYIMDEQLRELHFEKLRIFTLGRLGQLVERNRKVNPIVGANIGDHQDLFAIHYSEIQKNTEAELEQNPGY